MEQVPDVVVMLCPLALHVVLPPEPLLVPVLDPPPLVVPPPVVLPLPLVVQGTMLPLISQCVPVELVMIEHVPAAVVIE